MQRSILMRLCQTLSFAFVAYTQNSTTCTQTCLRFGVLHAQDLGVMHLYLKYLLHSVKLMNSTRYKMLEFKVNRNITEEQKHAFAVMDENEIML